MELSHRQHQALIMPTKSIAHIRDSAHLRIEHGFRTTLCVTAVGGRMRWWVMVAAFANDHPLALSVMGKKRLYDMECVARELLYLKEPPSQSVGKGRFDLSPGQFALNLYRELTEDEIKLLPEDWQQYPEARMDGQVPPAKG